MVPNAESCNSVTRSHNQVSVFITVIHNYCPPKRAGLGLGLSVGGLCVVCSLVDLSLNFTMVMGSFKQKHVLILIGQSEIWEGVWAHSH